MFMHLYVEAHSWENRSIKNTKQMVHDCPNWGVGGLNFLRGGRRLSGMPKKAVVLA